jgi:hypothetical protein
MRWFQDEKHMKNELVLIKAFTLMNNGKDFFFIVIGGFCQVIIDTNRIIRTS